MTRSSVTNQFRRKKHIELREHCRFTLHFPTSSKDPDPASQLIQYATKSLIDRINLEYKGSTFSNVQHSAFQGFWLDDSVSPSIPYPSTVSVMFVDIAVSFSSPDKINEIVDKMRKLAYSYYKKSGVAQKEIWVTVSPILIRMYVDNVRTNSVNRLTKKGKSVPVGLLPTPGNN